MLQANEIVVEAMPTANILCTTSQPQYFGYLSESAVQHGEGVVDTGHELRRGGCVFLTKLPDTVQHVTCLCSLWRIGHDTGNAMTLEVTITVKQGCSELKEMAQLKMNIKTQSSYQTQRLV